MSTLGDVFCKSHEPEFCLLEKDLCKINERFAAALENTELAVSCPFCNTHPLLNSVRNFVESVSMHEV